MSVRRFFALGTILWISATVAAFVASPHGGNTGRSEATLTDSVPAGNLDGLTLLVPGGGHVIDVHAAGPGAPDVVSVQVLLRSGSPLGFISKPRPPVQVVTL